MKKCFSLVTVSLMALAMVFSMPFKASAASTDQAEELFDPGKSCSLTVSYKSDKADVSGAGISLYRVAEWSERYDYTLTEEFASWGIDPQQVESSDQWLTLADTLDSFIQSDAPKPYAEAKVSETGMAEFAELPAGLYFIPALNIAEEKGTRTFSHVLLHLPELADQEWNYSVTTAPKSESYTPTYSEIEHSIIVIWDDKGHEDQRPDKVTVDIYKDDKLVDTITISAKDNWQYKWTSDDDGSVWKVVASKLNKYVLTVKEVENGWVIEYHLSQSPAPVPGTGEDFPWLPIVLLSVSGAALVVFGIVWRRKSGKKDDEQ